MSDILTEKKYQSTYIYPVMENEIRVPANPEMMAIQGSCYYFSPIFKRSKMIVEAILKKYQKKKNFLGKFMNKSNFFVSLDFDRKMNETVMEYIDQLKKNYKQVTGKRLFIGHSDILALYKSERNVFLLTIDKIYSTTIYDSDGRCFQKAVSEIGRIDSFHMYSITGEVLSECDSDFSDDFCSLFYEITELNKELHLSGAEHPLEKENQDTKKSYLDILVYKAYADGSLSAKEVIRLEMIARHLRISSKVLLNMLEEAVEQYGMGEGQYFQKAFENNLSILQPKYDYVLLNEMSVFDVITSKQAAESECSDFVKQFIQRRNLNHDFIETYQRAMQALVKDSCYIYQMMLNIGDGSIFYEEQMLENVFKSIQFEYAMQANLIENCKEL